MKQVIQVPETTGFDDDLLGQTFVPIDEQLLKKYTSSQWGFTQGLLLGQLSVIVVIVLFIRFFVFSESAASNKTAPKEPIINKRIKNYKTIDSQSSPLLSLDNEGLPQSAADLFKAKVSAILEKTYYDVKTHQSESLDWFNVLVAQMISQFRDEALSNDNIYHSLRAALSSSDLPDYLDTINITEINIGSDFPIFSNCRIKQNELNGRLEAKIDVDLSDTLTLEIETKLLLNYPKTLTASLPIQLSVSIVRFSGCLTVSLITASDEELEDDSSSSAKGVGLMFSFSPDYRLEFEIKSLIGSRTKLEDIPRLSSIIDSQLRNWFVERCIEPRFQLIKLPSLWPRKKNTRQDENDI
ncbi:unnamed protein product [Kuraishia capsulata CBS 1993]|uniref:Maintenance of mitochondrial morphology protein 1 n=1 Tax=Kuraishia capsulata CBS 1993 TaxID=1382522 RepID=W6MI23_9ASCO|nr:uncharacterized protein KUCA_T00002000001 [Kuraishia capsulata CBS 1993]CDK26029.1 unnamed protein product [Kuraishia capsulata CBS 1993]